MFMNITHMICNNIRKQPYKQYFLGPIYHRHVDSIQFKSYPRVSQILRSCNSPMLVPIFFFLFLWYVLFGLFFCVCFWFTVSDYILASFKYQSMALQNDEHDVLILGRHIWTGFTGWCQTCFRFTTPSSSFPHRKQELFVCAF
jgi:hypothetical protein